MPSIKVLQNWVFGFVLVTGIAADRESHTPNTTLFLAPRVIGRSTGIKSWLRRIKEEVVINSNAFIGEAEAWREQAEDYSHVGAYGRSS